MLSAIYSISGRARQNFDTLITSSFSFYEVRLKRDVKLAVTIFFYVSLGHSHLHEILLKPVQYTLCILEFSRLSQGLHVKYPRLLKSALTFIVCEA